MRDPVAEVRPAVDVDALARSVRQKHVALQDAERAEKRTAEQAEQAREAAGRLRLDLGRSLIQARKGWPARGPKAKGWGDFLREQGIGEQSAREWMRLAGYVEEISKPDGDGFEIPTRREMQEAQRPRKVDEPAPAPPPSDFLRAPDPPRPWTEDPAPVVSLSTYQPAPVAAGLDEDVLGEISRQADDVDRKAQALRSAAQRLTGLLGEHQASVTGPRAALARAAILRAKTAIQDCYALTSGDGQ